MRLLIISLFLISSFIIAKDSLAQDCTNPEGDLGVLRFNVDYGILQICTAQNWLGLHSMTCPDGDACAGAADAFAFTDVTGATTSTQIESNIIQVSGLAAAGTVSITGDGSPEFRICSAADCSTEITPWGSTNQAINTGDYLQLGLTSSASDSALHSATATINGTSDQWDVTTGVSPPANCDNIGQQCDDGSYYIGLSPEDGTKVYVTAAAHETSSRWDEEPPCYRCGLGDTGATSITDGRGNVEALRAYGGDNATAGTLDGFGAAKYCDNLTGIHGHDDWYLPAGGANGSSSEINLIWLMVQAEGAVGGLNTSGSWYWSSSEANSTNARVQRFSDGLQHTNGKQLTVLVRCVRR
jgi:hypothetical protein